MDQHDKWGRFGLWLYLGVDPGSGHFAWFKVWWCNRNAHFLISYYIEAGHKVGGLSSATGLSDSLLIYMLYMSRYSTPDNC